MILNLNLVQSDNGVLDAGNSKKFQILYAFLIELCFSQWPFENCLIDCQIDKNQKNFFFTCEMRSVCKRGLKIKKLVTKVHLLEVSSYFI